MKKRGNGAEAIYKETASENFSKWIRDIKSQIEKPLQNTKQNTHANTDTHTEPSRYILMKLQETKERGKMS